MENISIIIPVYNDWDTIQKCLDSIIKYVDKRHKIIIVNDRGPDFESIEHSILEKIKKLDNFHYFRNYKNLGFVKTCNYAVFELDQTENNILLLNSDTEITEGSLEAMMQIMDEKCGVVCPRSNNATILTIPFYIGEEKFSPLQSYSIFVNLKNMMPDKTIIPTGVGFAMLIKRDIINRYGLFDEIYGRGYNEENDFCQRIIKKGYYVAMANKAFVFHLESKSFGKEKEQLDRNNYSILLTRYPWYQMKVDKYLRFSMSGLEYYSSIIGRTDYYKKKILIDLRYLYKEKKENCKWKCELIRKFYKENCHVIYFITDTKTNELYNLKNEFQNIFIIEKELNQIFDIGIIMSNYMTKKRLYSINIHCLKYILFYNKEKFNKLKFISLITGNRKMLFQFCDKIFTVKDFKIIFEEIEKLLSNPVEIDILNKRYAKIIKYKIIDFYIYNFILVIKKIFISHIKFFLK